LNTEKSGLVQICQVSELNVQNFVSQLRRAPELDEFPRIRMGSGPVAFCNSKFDEHLAYDSEVLYTSRMLFPDFHSMQKLFPG
ncbi:MAG TPA: hypothetical protein VFO70_10585, partial [Chitinophagaceae bacterium]|nr:hypothetical protein [Chitinophagaceae bacterium]